MSQMTMQQGPCSFGVEGVEEVGFRGNMPNFGGPVSQIHETMVHGPMTQGHGPQHSLA